MKVFGISGHSGSGKTTLIEALLPVLAARGVRTSVIKHTHHDFELEPQGKDSARFREAGAWEVMTVSDWRYAIVHELRERPMPDLAGQLARLTPCDLVLVEGFHADPIDRLEVFRPSLGRALRCEGDSHLVAIATNEPVATPPVPLWPLDDVQAVAQRILAHVGLEREVPS